MGTFYSCELFELLLCETRAERHPVLNALGNTLSPKKDYFPWQRCWRVRGAPWVSKYGNPSGPSCSKAGKRYPLDKVTIRWITQLVLLLFIGSIVIYPVDSVMAPFEHGGLFEKICFWSPYIFDILDSYVVVNWHLPKQGIRGPVSRDHIAVSSVS